MIPKPLRERLGITPGVVEVMTDGTALRIEPLADDLVDEREGRLMIATAGAEIDDQTLLALRDADRR